MYLQLADSPGNRTGYTWVPYSDDNLNVGAYVRNDVLEAAKKATGLNDDDAYLSGFFSSLWGGIKNVASGIIKMATGSGSGSQSSQPITVNVPSTPAAAPAAPAPSDGKILGMDKNTALLVGGGLLLVLLMKRH